MVVLRVEEAHARLEYERTLKQKTSKDIGGDF